jgi:hypothetical protein
MDEIAVRPGLIPIELRLRHLPEGASAAAGPCCGRPTGPLERARRRAGQGRACCVDYPAVVAAVAGSR